MYFKTLLSWVAALLLVGSLFSCQEPAVPEPENPQPTGPRFRPKTISYYKLRYGYSSGQQDVFIYDKNNRLDSSTGVYGGSYNNPGRKTLTTYAYDSKGRLASFDYRFYVQLDILYKLGHVVNFAYSNDGRRVITTQINHDPSLNTNNYQYKRQLDYNSANQLVSTGAIEQNGQVNTISSYVYQNGNLVQEENNGLGKIRYTYEYDDKPNPFYQLEGYPEYLTSWRKLSKNNLKRVTVQVLTDYSGKPVDDLTFIVENILVYDKNGLLTQIVGGDKGIYNAYWDYQDISFTYEQY